MGSSGRRVLVIEDDFEIRDAIASVLQDEGYAVATAEHGAAGRAYLRDHEPPCLILLDLMMPVMDGWQFCEAKARDPAIAKVPVIVMSAAPPDATRDACLGATKRLRKPIDIDALLMAVAEVCG